MTHAATFDRSDFEEIADGVELAIVAMPPAVRDEILTLDALEFVADLQREFGARRLELLDGRIVRQDAITAGGTLDFLPETAQIRAASWQVAPPAPGLIDRRVEITGPTDAKMTINALNSGAKVWLADFEDANTPLWENMVGGHLNLRAAIDGTLQFTSPEGKHYTLTSPSTLPTIVVRPRGWHLTEKHVLVDGQPMSGSLFDFGMYLFHCGQRQIDAGNGPYFYLPKLESHFEARLWNDVFVYAQAALGIPRGTIRATVLIETIWAAFEMDEILYELREHSSGLNAGRWDYLFSLMKVFRARGSDFLLPDRNAVTMTAPMMRAYTDLLVATCHRRGAHAIGGMAAFIPNRRDAELNSVAMAKVRADKEREAGDGFDGSWVAHPDLVPVCDDVFAAVLGENPDQRDQLRGDVRASAAQILNAHATPGAMTEEGLRNNISVAVQYLSSWLRGGGAVAINNMMEDAATAEICRTQVWQWLNNDVMLSNGRPVTRRVVSSMLNEELRTLGGDYAAGRDLFEEVTLTDEFVDFLTLPAYERMH
ncbi:MAG TPA: malate synthase A [Acidothermaceae bacterium]